MRFSEAMLLGLPEIHFTNAYWLHSFNNPEKGKECGGCLIGAGLYAAGEREQHNEHNVYHQMVKRWPWVEKLEGESWRCPHCDILQTGFREWPILHIATHLANHYAGGSMTAEQIADTFRELEDQYGTQVQVTATVEAAVEDTVTEKP
jgi:hypothetical protein